MDIDDGIERVLSEEAERAVVGPELMRTVLRRARVRRVRYIGLAMVSLAAIVAGITAASMTLLPSERTGPAGRIRGVVPWVDRPAPPSVPSPIPSPVFPSAQPCRATDLRVAGARLGAATGTVYLQISLRNVSSSPCELRGYPTVVGLSSGDGATVLPTSHEGLIVGPTAPAPPGSVIEVVVSTFDMCSPRGAYPALRLRLPSGGDLDVRQRFVLGCGLSVGPFGVPSLAARAHEVTSPLRITAQLPTTAVASSTLQYTITITNTGDRPFPLLPCPSYEEFIGVGAPSGDSTTRRDYYLNCDSLAAIAPHRTVTYAMAINVPNLPGYAKFLWQLHVPEIPSGGGTLQVVPPEPSP